MIVIIILSITAVCVFISLLKSHQKTKEAFKFSYNMLKGMVLQIISILALVALLFSIIPKPWISKALGEGKEIVNILWGAILGTITIIPGIIAFPLAKNLYVSGAALAAIAAFITTLTMVGFATMPIEIKAFGKKFTIVRNSVSLGFALIIALLMGVFI